MFYGLGFRAVGLQPGAGARAVLLSPAVETPVFLSPYDTVTCARLGVKLWVEMGHNPGGSTWTLWIRDW